MGLKFHPTKEIIFYARKRDCSIVFGVIVCGFVFGFVFGFDFFGFGFAQSSYKIY